ncbi:hypothetical protein PDESU_00202 [Pontiella desulfatans]|uniref:HEPN AbiU2-like domain-containing protein n=1 Tax=Pontiella desulfatans TaxID=2750659 RepID=A0A6C2TVS8_PONDE|nr:hypothetical protein [Pontiella desulfatans]VGO11657.1 hypothetical protein PDESU_00202 [Pontiella desulfatans]
MSKQAVQKQKPLDDSYWIYFLKLESDFHAATQYVACTETNDATCSIEFAKQIVCICTECEGILKKLCKMIDPKNQAVNMGHYKRTILSQFPEIHKAPVDLDRFHRTEHPFAEWASSGGRLDWWNAYQDVKHHRDSNLEKANLKNTLDALCALLVLNLYLYGSNPANGTATLGGTLLLRAPGMARTENVPPTDALPHLSVARKPSE